MGSEGADTRAAAHAASWQEGPLAALDFETTGTDPLRDRPVSAALLVFAPSGERLPGIGFRGLINAGVEIPAEASAIHGITTERVRREGMPAAEAAQQIAETLATLKRQGIGTVIQNARFDFPLATVEAARHGHAVPPDLPLIDPLVLDRRLQRSRQGGRRTLSDLARYYDVPLADAHDAEADARAAVGVARRMVAQPMLRDLSLEELQQRQAEWFASWRNSTNAFYALKGRTDRIEGSWPWGALARPGEPPVWEAAADRDRPDGPTPDRPTPSPAPIRVLRLPDPVLDSGPAAAGGNPGVATPAAGSPAPLPAPSSAPAAPPVPPAPPVPATEPPRPAGPVAAPRPALTR